MSPSLAGLRIVVVDDDDDSRWLVATVLRLYSAEVLACDSADQALKAIADFNPNVIVSDIMMPDHDGYWLVHEIRKLGRGLGGTPAIALSACATKDDQRRSSVAGFQRHILKPFEFEKLIQAICELAPANGKWPGDRK